jgi:2-polyprenyl-3-methyl-5-hydroxy-6-metoxy-1,4-benzoquinol methylase
MRAVSGPPDHACPICGAQTVDAGSKTGTFKPTTFHLRHCPACHFSFVSNPWTDYAEIYSAEYYAGRGADPLVDYLNELAYPDKTIRRHEWRGVLEIIDELVGVRPDTQWLDYGCGNGGLVRYVRAHSPCAIVGFEDGWIRAKAEALGVPYIDEEALAAREGTFDVITAVEVIEHVPDPVAFLKRLRRLLKPGGLFFCTTGNARPYRDRIRTWRYVLPEVHMSFFEPETLARALELAGFRPEYRGFLPGYTDVIRFKLLKNLHLRRRSVLEGAVPWRIVARLIDRELGISAHPIGWAA